MIFNSDKHCQCRTCGAVHRRKGQTTQKKKQRELRDTEIISLYLSEYTSKQIGATLGCSAETVRSVLIVNEIPLRSRRRKKVKTQDNIQIDRKQFINQCFSEKDFWQHVNKSDDLTACWLWQETISTKGYGLVNYEGVWQKAHRVSFYLHNGHFSINMTLHKCNNPPCVNPYHLYDGTAKENSLDYQFTQHNLNRHTVNYTPNLQELKLTK